MNVRSKHPLNGTFKNMVTRCENPNSPSYKHYGGRGITICQRWRNNFWTFVSDVGERPPGMTLHRIDPDGPYSPENCRWATWQEQNQNRVNTNPDSCPKGHAYPENLGITNRGWRKCMECDRIAHRKAGV